MKLKLVDEALDILESAGYRVLNCDGSRSCFDIIAKRDTLLLIKILANVDGLSRACSLDLRDVASLISAVPVVLGDHMKSTKLCRGIVYARYDVCVMNAATMGDIVNGRMPSMYSIRGNYCIRVDSNLLVSLRKKQGMTQQDLADRLGVSKQSIHRYEFSGRVSADIAGRLMGVLECNIAVPNEVFVSERVDYSREYVDVNFRLTKIKGMVFDKFREMGFFTALTNAPFDIVAIEYEGEKILTVVSEDSRRLGSKMDLINEVSGIVGGYGVCISNRREESDVVIMKPSELSRLRDKQEFISMLEGS